MSMHSRPSGLQSEQVAGLTVIVERAVVGRDHYFDHDLPGAVRVQQRPRGLNFGELWHDGAALTAPGLWCCAVHATLLDSHAVVCMSCASEGRLHSLVAQHAATGAASQDRLSKLQNADSMATTNQERRGSERLGASAHVVIVLLVL